MKDIDKRGNEWPGRDKGMGGLPKIAVGAYGVLGLSGVGALLLSAWQIFAVGFILFLMLAAVDAGSRHK